MDLDTRTMPPPVKVLFLDFDGVLPRTPFS